MKKAICIIACALVTFGSIWLFLLGNKALAVLAIFVALVFSTIANDKEEPRNV